MRGLVAGHQPPQRREVGQSAIPVPGGGGARQPRLWGLRPPRQSMLGYSLSQVAPRWLEPPLWRVPPLTRMTMPHKSIGLSGTRNDSIGTCQVFSTLNVDLDSPYPFGMATELTPQEKLALIRQNLQEVLKPEIIEDVIVKQNRPLAIYLGRPRWCAVVHASNRSMQALQRQVGRTVATLCR